MLLPNLSLIGSIHSSFWRQANIVVCLLLLPAFTLVSFTQVDKSVLSQVKKEKRFLSLVFLVGRYEIWQGSIQTKERSLRAKASLDLPQQKWSSPVNEQRLCEAGAFLLSTQCFIDSALWYLWKNRLKCSLKHVTSKHYYCRSQSLSTFGQTSWCLKGKGKWAT